MLVIDPRLKKGLERLNSLLSRRQIFRPPEIRRILTEKGFAFLQLTEMPTDEIASWAGPKPVIAIDGSSNRYGSSHPYVVLFFQACARSTRSTGEIRMLTASRLFSPLVPGSERLIKMWRNRGLTDEDALTHIYWQTLARLELVLAIRALRKFCPRLIIFDGGLSRLKQHGQARWDLFERLAKKEKVAVVGVIEEVSTSFLCRELPGQKFLGDREILFGLLKPREILIPPQPFKDGLINIYARLGHHPQAVACEFLEDQRDELLATMSFLATITPYGGRGFPFLIDLVDNEIRLTDREVELLLSAFLDYAHGEKFLLPHRLRREF